MLMFMCVLVIEGERGGGAVGSRRELRRFSAVRRGGKRGFPRHTAEVERITRGAKVGRFSPRSAAGVGRLSTKCVRCSKALASIASRFPSVQDDNSWINSLAVSIDDSYCSAMDEVPLSIEHIWWKTSLPRRRFISTSPAPARLRRGEGN